MEVSQFHPSVGRYVVIVRSALGNECKVLLVKSSGRVLDPRAPRDRRLRKRSSQAVTSRPTSRILTI